MICDQEMLKQMKIDHGCVTSVELVPEGPLKSPLPFELETVPAHWRVAVHLTPSQESNINIMVWLPAENWNGKLLGIGSGGSGGFFDEFSLADGVRRGYAAVNTDLGTLPSPETMIGKPERWADFGYRATHLMTVAAKQMIEAFYGQPPRHSYFRGGSTGGQQALSEAQRYPEDYDGILAVAPANNRTHLHMAFAWNWIALTRDPEAAISQADAEKITKRILEHYGDTAGRNPGDQFLTRPDKIKMDVSIFDDILKPGQIGALKKVYEGPVNPVSGERIFAPVVTPGSECCNLGLAEQSNAEKFGNEFLYPLRWALGADFDFYKFDFNADAALVDKKLAAILNADNPDLSGFQNAGGKLLMLHGMADPIIPYADSLRYYQRVVEAQGGLEKTMSFFRYFMIPGFAHTFGGPGVQDIGMLGFRATPRDREHDALEALAAWVEDGIAPECLHPVAFKDGSIANGFTMDQPEYERLVYVYPNVLEN